MLHSQDVELACHHVDMPSVNRQRENRLGAGHKLCYARPQLCEGGRGNTIEDGWEKVTAGPQLRHAFRSRACFAAVCFLVARLHLERKEGVPYTRTKGRQKEKEGSGAWNRKVLEGYEAGNGGPGPCGTNPRQLLLPTPKIEPKNRKQGEMLGHVCNRKCCH